MVSATAPPAALPPRAPGLRHRLRARRAGSRRGVEVRGVPRLGRGVVLDVTEGARVVLEEGCVLLDGCRIHARGGEVRIRAGALLGERCAVLCHDRVDVGRGCVLGDGVVLVDFAHRHADADRPVRLQGLTTAPVVVGDGARIGPGAVLERGARIPPAGTVPAHRVVGAARRGVPPR